jgi:predicted DNA binding CopG/RHH family protein
MADRHKTKPLSLRLPEALSAWVQKRSAETGLPVRRVILDAIEAAKEREEA